MILTWYKNFFVLIFRIDLFVKGVKSFEGKFVSYKNAIDNLKKLGKQLHLTGLKFDEKNTCVLVVDGNIKERLEKNLEKNKKKKLKNKKEKTTIK